MSLYFPSTKLPFCCIQQFQSGLKSIKSAGFKFLPSLCVDSTTKNATPRRVVDYTKASSQDWSAINEEFLKAILADNPQLKAVFDSLQLEHPEQLLEKLSKYLPEEVKKSLNAADQKLAFEDFEKFKKVFNIIPFSAL